MGNRLIQVPFLIAGLAVAAYGVTLPQPYWAILILFGLGVLLQHGAYFLGRRGPLPRWLILVAAIALVWAGYSLHNVVILFIGVYCIFSKFADHYQIFKVLVSLAITAAVHLLQ